MQWRFEMLRSGSASIQSFSGPRPIENSPLCSERDSGATVSGQRNIDKVRVIPAACGEVKGGALQPHSMAEVGAVQKPITKPAGLGKFLGKFPTVLVFPAVVVGPLSPSGPGLLIIGKRCSALGRTLQDRKPAGR